MRIIAGELRGRRIAAPPGRGTRPMLDRVREALFSSLQPWMPDAVVLDLFAGSGSLGLEALSRGARRVRMVERGAPAVAQLRKNVEALGVRDRVEIVVADALAPSSWLRPVDVVLLDPPYALVEDARARVLRTVRTLVDEHLSDDGVLVLHAARGAVVAGDLGPDGVRLRRYGTNDLWYVRRH